MFSSIYSVNIAYYLWMFLFPLHHDNPQCIQTKSRKGMPILVPWRHGTFRFFLRCDAD